MKNKYPVYTFLQPAGFNSYVIKEIASFTIGNENAKNDIYFIYDYDCPTCKKADSIMNKLVQSNNDKMKFKYIYYSDYINKTILACDASERQDKFKNMHDLMIASTDTRNDSLMIAFASSLNLNIDEFLKDYYNDSFIKKHLRNKQILSEMGIYSVPCFIVNGEFIGDLPTFEYVISQLNASLYEKN